MSFSHSIFILITMVIGCHSLSAQQNSYPREDLDTFYKIFMEAKSLKTHIENHDIEIIQRKLKLADHEVKTLILGNQKTRNQDDPSFEHPFFDELNSMVANKNLQKEKKIKSLCIERNFSLSLYNEILKKYNESTAFQNIVCQNIQ